MVFKLPVLDLLFAFLFLVPGFLTYRLARHVGKITVQTDSFNKTAYALIASGVAISITWITATLLFGIPFSALVQVELSVFQSAWFYLGVVGVSCVQGVVAGLVVDRGLRRDHRDRRKRVWALAFNGSDQPIEARVVTAGGDEIHGYVQSWDSVGHGKDILLRYPRRLNEEHEEIGDDDGLFIGEYVLLNEGDISQIYFEDDIDIE
ncbi:hypothetical protein C454_18389 [Haloferax gibbonsii ATCC 33959]|uniref:Uncharacterized protein n=1 Tax=Haloferax gibbonsii (strain ATCC 33959 / DSM 4427 / JCM 8863 / NBRC 102184 / NCIMB 2188 / Ma 2.38) TaxID=1227459 RepID=M0GXJ2_HALGM|nr:DUF6338 family protein [Haloferax gibbonsii]ELZ76293.1 hypothetical protein C454_18389 [Haloferax gibbonsii ATCC 33959]